MKKGRHEPRAFLARARRAVALVALLAACRGGELRGQVPAVVAADPPRPERCTELLPGASLQQAVDAAGEGGALCLPPGEVRGPVRIAGGRTLWGTPASVIRTAGSGTTVRLEGKGTRLLGVTVDGSGGRYDTLDAAVHVEGEGHVVEGVRVKNATFGVLVEKATRVRVEGNHVVGSREDALGLRGDGIRLWETTHSIVRGNRVEHGRDVVVWYSSDNEITGNVVEGGRYGTHFMYSHRNAARGNHYLGNVVGIFVMYSRDLAIEDNLVADASGAAGVGLGLKESGNLSVRRNRFLHDTTGIYVDTSPLQKEDVVEVEHNELRMGQAGVVFHGSPERIAFRHNVFKDNAVQVRVEGGGDALGIVWERNFFDDYEGYDLDGDGTGDVPYQLRSLSADLISRYPDLEFLRGAPALALVNVASEVVPLLAPRLILRDPLPRFGEEG